MPRICLLLLLVLAGLPGFSLAAEKPGAELPAVAFQTYEGYFVSNQFEAGAPTSFVVLKDQVAFDQVFGVARVMRDKSHRLAAGAFDGQMVVAAIHRGKSVVTYQVERVAADGKTLLVRYTTKAEPGGSAEFACPLILSVPAGDYAAVRFIEDGQEIKKVEVPRAVQFEITAREAGTLIATAEGGRTILSIKGGRGIGQASVRRVGEAWPEEMVVRAYLGGLEQFSVSDGRVKLAASVASHSGNGQTLALWEGGKEGPPLDGKSPYAMEIRSYDATGQRVKSLPPKGGWFEMTLPRALLKAGNRIELEWVDFYR